MDPDFFCDTVQGTMWNLHSTINNHYRQTLQNLQKTRAAVSRSKLEKSHVRFLKTSFDFYKGFVQRLAAKYGVPELQKAARRMDLTPPGAPLSPADKVSPALQRRLLQSCAMMVVHLGDLTRYLSQARPKKSKQRDQRHEEASDGQPGRAGSHTLDPYAYHDLASQLMPSLGHPHHQIAMALINKNDFDMIFHLVKAMAVELPHPSASHNLEQKFKQLRTTEANAPPSSQDSLAILKMWFLRLMGIYHGGEKRTDRLRAMETEFTGRLRDALGTEQDSPVVVNKMALVSISAHYLAKQKLLGKWSDTQHEHSIANTFKDHPQDAKAGAVLDAMLGFNVVFFGTVLDRLKWELGDLKKAQAHWDTEHPDGTARDEQDQRPQGSAEYYACLPPARLYASWLVATANEVRDAPSVLHGHINQMLDFFALVLTQLSDIYGANEDMKITPYLLPEDMLGRGMYPLNSPKMPEACLLSFDQEARRDKVVLEDYEEAHGLWSQDRETMSRTLDILFCGYHLAEGTTLPLKLNSSNGLQFYVETEQDTRDFLHSAQGSIPQSHSVMSDVQYSTTNGAAPLTGKVQQQLDYTSNAQEAPAHDARQNLSHGVNQRGSESSVQHTRGKSPGSPFPVAARVVTGDLPPPSPPNGYQNTSSFAHGGSGTLDQASIASIWGDYYPVPKSMQQQPKTASEPTDYSFSDDSAIMSIINPFLQPPATGRSEPRKQRDPAAFADETSYGMHSSTANEVFNGMDTRSPGVPSSTSPSAFHGLPWPLVHSPTPNAAELKMAGPPGMPAPNLRAPAPWAAAADSQRLGSAFGSMGLDGSSGNSYSASSSAQHYPQHGAVRDPADVAHHRARLLQAFGRTASSQGSPAAASGSRSGGAGSQERGRQHSGGGNYFPGSSDPVFSDPSSVYQSTPYGARPAFDAFAGATVYGRGPRVDRADDPTSFKTKTRAAGMGECDEYADAYDRLTYQSVREEIARKDGRFG